MNVVILFDDTARALGLRYILNEYFDIKAEIIPTTQNLEGADSPNTLYFISPEIHAQALDFFIPRRNRTVITGQQKPLLVLTQCESNIVEQIRSLLEDRDTQQPSSSAELSQREIEVLRLVAMGKINKEIADRLNISINTVLSHRKNITAKLGIRSVSGLSVYAMMNGYVNEADLNM